MEQQHQKSKQIKTELVTINSELLYLSKATEVINKISVNIPSQFLISKIATSFDKNFDQISMNRRIEVDIFEPEPKFEKLLTRSKIII